jgi:hypothetical protein
MVLATDVARVVGYGTELAAFEEVAGAAADSLKLDEPGT